MVFPIVTFNYRAAPNPVPVHSKTAIHRSGQQPVPKFVSLSNNRDRRNDHENDVSKQSSNAHFFKNLRNPSLSSRMPSTTSFAISSAPAGRKCVLSSTPLG